MSPELLAELAHRLTGRDRHILELVWTHRVLTTHQLAAICFSTPGKARHRLLELYRMSALERAQPWTPIGTQPWHWVLGPAGAHVLAGHRGIDLAELGYKRTAALAVCHSRQLGHQIGVNDFFAQLHQHARHRNDNTAVAAWWPQRRCAALWGDLVRPDAYGRWTEPIPNGGSIELDFFLEHDTGSEPLPKVAEKLAGYAALAESTGIPTPVLFSLPSQAREANLRKLLRDSPVPVATAVHPFGDNSPAGPVWLPIGTTDRRVRLIDLHDPERSGAEPA
ncbi:replication-relaxation family protein [Actinomadura harenae]|nr:replication-relaxation family protein [Actinomadura harenae]